MIVAGMIATPAAAQQLCFPEAADIPEVGIPVPEPALTTDGEERLTITAGQIDLVDENRLAFDGEVAFRYGERSISAERASFDLLTETAEVNGTVAYRDPRVAIYGQDAEVDTRGRIITFREGGFELPLRGAQGFAEAIQIRGDNTIGLRSVNFTTCLTDPPDWELLARELEMDVDAGFGTARGFRLRFKGFPVLASPWVTFPLDDRRKSGVLTPTFSNRDSTGVDVSLPVYLYLAPHYDFTFTTRYMRERGTQGNSEFRYLLPRTEGQIRFEYLPEDRRLGISRRYFSYRNDTDLSESWQFVADLQQVSDFFYFEDMHNNLSAASQTHLNRAFELGYRAPRWSFLGRVQDMQTIDPFIGPGLEPYRRLPQFLLSGDWRRNAFRLDSRNELVRFDREIGVTGWRLDLEEEAEPPPQPPRHVPDPRAGPAAHQLLAGRGQRGTLRLRVRRQPGDEFLAHTSRRQPRRRPDVRARRARARLAADHRAAGALRPRALRGAVPPAVVRHRGAHVQFRAVVPQVPLPGRRPDRRHRPAQRPA